MQAPEKIQARSEGNRFLWDADTYMRACQMGLFEGHRVELIEGEIIELNAHSGKHIVGVHKTYDRLRELFPRNSYVVTGQSTLYSSERSRPEPDVAVFRADWNDILAEAPLCPVLVVEVSLETLAYDRGDKASFYAKLGVRDYWVLNLRDELLEVRRDPQSDANARHGWRYAREHTFQRGEHVAPLELSHVSVEVDELLP